MKLRRAAADMGAKVSVGCGDRLLSGALILLAMSCSVGSLQAQIAWKRTYGGFGADNASSVRTTPDDGALICGSTGSFGQGGEMYVIKIDAYGEIEWSRYLGGAGVEIGGSAEPQPDGSMIVVGTTNSFGAGGYDGYLVKLDGNGTTLWERTFGGASWDLLHGMIALDDGFVLVGQSYSYGSGQGQIWVVRAASDGSELWSRTFPSAGDDEARDVTVLENGDLVAVGTARINGADPNLLLVCYSSSGELRWSRECGGADREIGYSVAATDPDGVAAVGYTSSYSPKRQMFMSRVTADGNELWSQPISSAGNDWESHAVAQRMDGTFAVAGYTKEYGAGEKDISLLFIDQGGGFISGPTYGGAGDDEAWGVDLTADGGYYVAGSTTSYGPGIEAMFIVRSDGDTLNGSVVPSFDPVGILSSAATAPIGIHPDPVAAGALVNVTGLRTGVASIKILDVQGRVLFDKAIYGGSFTAPAVNAGVYSIRIVEQARSTTLRLVIE